MPRKDLVDELGGLCRTLWLATRNSVLFEDVFEPKDILAAFDMLLWFVIAVVHVLESLVFCSGAPRNRTRLGSYLWIRRLGEMTRLFYGSIRCHWQRCIL